MPENSKLGFRLQLATLSLIEYLLDVCFWGGSMGRGFAAALGTIWIMSWAGYPATAADLKAAALKDGRVVITISGDLDEGDARALGATIKMIKGDGKPVTFISLNSPGGSLLEAVQIVEVVRYEKLATIVGPGAKCASACFLIFAAGQPKLASYTAQIGVHNASDETGQETAKTSTATLSMARVAKELGVPSAIIGRMVVTRPNEMVWLSAADLQSMGTSMVGSLLRP